MDDKHSSSHLDQILTHLAAVASSTICTINLVSAGSDCLFYFRHIILLTVFVLEYDSFQPNKTSVISF